jgi:WD40-like Beta Propeller Repeat
MTRARGALFALALGGGALTGAWARPAHAGDPYLDWYTVKSPHFRVHYAAGLEDIAQRTTSSAEAVYRRLVPQLGWAPKQVTEIVVTDDTDTANGSANTIPYNTVRLFATAPDDMSPLGDYDNWINELVTHEYTHILQIDNTSGLPALGNAVLGKTYAPNQSQPRWILEGLAVVMESEHTSGGRLRSSQFDMYLRADVLEDRLARLDQISNPARRWPGGNLWYLYGANFIGWIMDTYGPDTYAAVATDYGASVIPFGINRAIRRVTGRTYEDLYVGWRAHLQRKYAAQTQAVRARGLREGRQVTHRGYNAASPRFLPRCGNDGGHDDVVAYQRDDGDTTGGVYTVSIDAPDPDDGAQLLARGASRSTSFDDQCNLYFDNTAPSRRLYQFSDLFRQPAGTRGASGLERSRERLTVGERANASDVSRDGQWLTYVTNRAGTSTLRIAHLDAQHALEPARALVPSARYEQAYTPRFSPDGLRVAYSAWTRGGYRDIRVVDVQTGAFFEVTHDRSIDQQPVWSPDGKTLYFVSDRTGMANVYAYELATGKLAQVTNVLTGAYMPAISNDGKRLVYVGYHSKGFDLYELPLDPARFLAALDPPDDRLLPVEPGISHAWPTEAYSPLPTLRPHAWTFKYGDGNFGKELQITTSGSDVIGRHGFDLTISVPTTTDATLGAEPQASANYYYNRLPFAFRFSAFRGAALRRDYRYGLHSYSEPGIVTTEHLNGITTGISWAVPGEFDGQSVSVSYTLANYNRDLPVGTRADPFSYVAGEPDRGYIALLHLGYAYSNVQSTVYGISGEKGFSIGLGFDEAAHALGSESTLTGFNGLATAYQLMPWGHHHVLALALSGGTSLGSYSRRGLYSTGGFVNDSLYDQFNSVVRQSSFVLRGYKPGQFIGTTYNLLNTEYRFPIWYADRGLSTLPAFLRTVSGVVFFDYGAAYDKLDDDHPFNAFRGSVGGELWIDGVTSYFIRNNLRFGVARRLFNGESGYQTYAVLVAGF